MPARQCAHNCLYNVLLINPSLKAKYPEITRMGIHLYGGIYLLSTAKLNISKNVLLLYLCYFNMHTHHDAVEITTYIILNLLWYVFLDINLSLLIYLLHLDVLHSNMFLIEYSANNGLSTVLKLF